MIKSLKLKFLLAFLSVALGTVLFTGLYINNTIDSSFYNYMEEKQKSVNQQIVNALAEYYKEYGGWNRFYVMQVARTIMHKDGSIEIKNLEGDIIFRTSERGSGIMRRRIITNTAEYKEDTIAVLVDGQKVGDVNIGYYGPGFISNYDVAFKDRLNTILIISGLFAIVLAVTGSLVFNRRLSGPISEIIDSTNKMAEGNLNIRVLNADRNDEIGQLARSVNRLGEWVNNLEDMRRQMTSDVAHEIRTPLTTLQGHLEAIMDGVWEPTPERISVCHNEVIRLSSLARDLETLSRYEKEGAELKLSDFNIGEMIGEVCRYFSLTFEEKGIILEVNAADDLSYRGDRDKIKQIVINLLSNALKYTGRDGRVEVKAWQTGDMLSIEIRDTGKGIKREDLPFIFERFYRGDKSRTRKEGGSGIGLSIVKAIAGLHGGDIEVESEVGRGSVFRVNLPLDKDNRLL